MRRFNYAKRTIFSFSAVLVCSALLSGCCTCGKLGADAAGIVSGNSLAAGRLEATVKALDGAVAGSRERIAGIIETSRGIADGVERLEYLFGQYESEVGRILAEVDRIRDEAQIQSESDSNGGGSPDAFCGSPVRVAGAEN